MPTVKQGTIDLLIFGLIFIGLQAWWLIPIIKKNIKLNQSNKYLIEERNQLERLYKK